MTKSTEASLRKSLYDALDAWWGSACDEHNMPYAGDNGIELAADSALNVILAIADAQDYLKREGYIKDNNVF